MSIHLLLNDHCDLFGKMSSIASLSPSVINGPHDVDKDSSSISGTREESESREALF